MDEFEEFGDFDTDIHNSFKKELDTFKEKKILKDLIIRNLGPISRNNPYCDLLPDILTNNILELKQKLPSTAFLEYRENNPLHLCISMFDLPGLEVDEGFTNSDPVILEVVINTESFPVGPPRLSLSGPKIANKKTGGVLLYDILQMKFLNPNYRNFTHDIIYIVQRITDILVKYGKKTNGISKYNELLSRVIEKMDASTLCCIGLEDTEHYYANVKSSLSSTTSKKKNNGTGYSGEHESSSKQFSMEEVLRVRDGRRKELAKSLEKLTDCPLAEVLGNTPILSLLKSLLNGVTFLEITQNTNSLEYYSSIIDILYRVAACNPELFMTDTCPHFSLSKIFGTLTCTFDKMGPSFIEDIDNPMERQLVNQIKEVQKVVVELETSKVSKSEKSDNTNLTAKPAELSYADQMKDFALATCLFTQFYYKNADMDAGKKIPRLITSQIMAMELENHINEDTSIFVRMNSSNICQLKVMITGPGKTPYDGGVFLFDLFVDPTKFPKEPPSMIFTSHGGKRFNPNLYDSGKICLSLLGTWQGEPWLPDKSTIGQILLSIQSMILIEEPYFNEPGYQRKQGTPEGNKENETYNKKIRDYTIQHAMIDIIKNPAPEFKQVIQLHFKLKRDEIMKTVKKWEEEDSSLATKVKELLSII